MQKTDNNPRRDFLKKIPLAVVSIGTFSLIKFKKSKRYFEKNFNTMSKSEADKMIKNDKFSISTQLKPAPAPVAQKKIEG